MKKFFVALLVFALGFINISQACASVSLSAFSEPVVRESLKRYDIGWAEFVGYNEKGEPIYEIVGKDDGILGDKEIKNIRILDFSGIRLSALEGIRHLTYLEELNCGSNKLTKLDVSGLSALKELNCKYNQLTELNVSGCSALKILYCGGNQLTKLNVSGCTALESLSCYDNQLTELNASGCSALQGLYCGMNQLTELNVSGCSALKSLHCDYNQLTELNASGCSALQVLNCKYNQLTKLNVSGCSALKDLDCVRNQLTELNVSGCTALKYLSCECNKLTKLGVSGCTALEYLYCHDNQLTELDLSSCSFLEEGGFSPQIIKNLKVKQTSEGYEVHLKNYVSKLENVDAESVGEDCDNLVHYDKTTGIALFSSYPKEINYRYHTHSPNDDLMDVKIKSPMGIAVLERTNIYNNLFDDMNDDHYLDVNGFMLNENNIWFTSPNEHGKIGFAADGNSRLIIRAQTDRPGRVTFSLVDDIGATLEQLTNRANKSTASLQVTTTEIDSELYQASAVIVAPEAFPRYKKFPSDKFKVQAIFVPSDGTTEDYCIRDIELTIKAAPVLLIPGMFDKAEKTFGIIANSKLGIYGSLLASGYKKEYIHFWNYDTSQGPNTLLQPSYNDLFMKIVRILNKYFDEKIVCTKVDIIAHGMGGLMARKFLSRENKNSDGNNWSTISYKQGMVRRLITVAAPHLGTPWADGPYRKNFITAMYNALLTGTFNGNHPFIEAFAKPLTVLAKGILETAQLAFAYNKDGAWAELTTTTPRTYGLPANVPMHSIIGSIFWDSLALNAYTYIAKLVDIKTGNFLDIINMPSLIIGIVKQSVTAQIKSIQDGETLDVLGKRLKRLKLANKVLGPLSIAYEIPSYMRTVVDVMASIYFNGEPNDLIVSHRSADGDGKINLTTYQNSAGDILDIFDDKRERYAHWSICRQNDVGNQIASLLKGSKEKFTTFDTEQYESAPSAAATTTTADLPDDIDNLGTFKFVDTLNLKIEPQVLRVSNNGTVKITLTSERSIKGDVFCVFAANDNDDNRFFKLPSNGTGKNFSAEFKAADLFMSMDKGIIEFTCLSFISGDSGITGAYVSNTVNVLSRADFDLSNKNIVSLDFLGETTICTSLNDEIPAGLYAIDDEGNYYDISSPLNGTQWTSTEIARVNDNGCIYGLQEGSTELTANFKGVTASINVVVGPAIEYDNEDSTPPQISTSTLDNAHTGKSYNFQLKASGSGTITWQIESGSLPEGLNLSESGLISGKPSKAGTYKFTVTASNGNESDSKEFAIIVTSSGASLEITTETLKAGTHKKNYSATIKAKGANNFTASGLPEGLNISATGKISGKPSEYGNFNVIITASNANESTQKSFSLVIKPVAPKISAKISTGRVHEEYSTILTISKGSNPVKWSVDYLPEGLTLNSETGKISGKPTQFFKGKINITASNDAGIANKSMTLKIDADKPAITSITHDGRSAAVKGQSYSISCEGTGTTPLIWSFTGLPEGMTGDSSTGKISGTPTESGKFKISVELTNMTGKIKRKKYTLIVYNPPAITTENLPDATYNNSYKFSLTAAGDKKIQWRAEGLPTGLKISSSGKISGKPTAKPGNYSVTITAYNAKIPDSYSQRETSKIFNLVINNNPDSKKAYNETQTQDSKDSTSASDSLNESGEKIISPEKLIIGPERNINSLNINLSNDYIIAAVLPEIQVTESGLYEIEVELYESINIGEKLIWLAMPKNHEPSEDDLIAEFYDETGQEITTVPESHLITVSAWFNKGVIYLPVIAVKSEK